VERLYVARPLYPLATVAFSTFALIGGLLIAKTALFVPALVALCALYVCFGYGVAVLRCLSVFVPLGFVLGALAWLAFGDVASVTPVAGRIVLLGLCAVPLVSTPPATLTRSLAALGCPRVVVLGALVAIRFIPVLAREMAQIREAMRTRGVRVGQDPRCVYRAFVIPLVMRIINISESLALSRETRAFDLKARQTSVYRPVRFTLRDGLFCACGLALIGTVALCAWAGLA
jgi:energy-coupling factor transport system permease protein/energy-coupling factor transport system ATP-binding protein